jgi:hypothetical protein
MLKPWGRARSTLGQCSVPLPLGYAGKVCASWRLRWFNLRIEIVLPHLESRVALIPAATTSTAVPDRAAGPGSRVAGSNAREPFRELSRPANGPQSTVLFSLDARNRWRHDNISKIVQLVRKNRFDAQYWPSALSRRSARPRYSQDRKDSAGRCTASLHCANLRRWLVLLSATPHHHAGPVHRAGRCGCHWLKPINQSGLVRDWRWGICQKGMQYLPCRGEGNVSSWHECEI